MSFMQPEVWQEKFYLVETSHGTEIIPLSVCGLITTADEPLEDDAEEWQSLGQEHFGDYCEGAVESFELSEGWLYRLSAPGYLDCTDTGHAETELEALEELLSLYGDSGEDWEQDVEDRISELKSELKA